MSLLCFILTKEYTQTHPTNEVSLCLFYDEELKSKLDSNSFLQQLPTIYTTIYNTIHPDHTVAGKAPLAVTWLSSSKLAIAVMQAKRPLFSPIPPVTTLPRITYPTLIDNKDENIDEGNAATIAVSHELPVDHGKPVGDIRGVSDKLAASSSSSSSDNATANINAAHSLSADPKQPPSALHQSPLPVIITAAPATTTTAHKLPEGTSPVPSTAIKIPRSDPVVKIPATSAISSSSSSSAHHTAPDTNRMNDYDHDNDMYDAYPHDDRAHNSSNKYGNVDKDGWLHVAVEASRHGRQEERTALSKQSSRTNKTLTGKQRQVAADDDEDEGHNYYRDDTIELPLHPADTVYAEIKLKPAVSTTRVGSGPKSTTAGQTTSQLIDRKRFQKNYVRSLDNHNNTVRGQNSDTHPSLSRASASDRRTATTTTTTTTTTTAPITGSAAVRKRGVDKVALDDLAEEEEEVRVVSKRRRRNG